MKKLLLLLALVSPLSSLVSSAASTLIGDTKLVAGATLTAASGATVDLHSATVTFADGQLAVAKVNGLQAALDARPANAATGTGSLALGFSATAAADYSLALGNNSTSSGYASVAVGSAIASGGASAAFGLNATASGDHSEAFGWSLTNSTDFSLEIGYTDSYKLQISSAGFNFIGAGITLNGTTPYQTPLTAGTDYLAPSGDGSGLTGIAWSQITGTQSAVNLSGFTNDAGFLTDVSGASVAYAATAGSVSTATSVYGPYANQLVNTSNLQWTMDGDLNVGAGGIGCEFLSTVFFGSRSSAFHVDTSGNAYVYSLNIGSGEVTIDNNGIYNSAYGSVTAQHFYGDGSGLTGVPMTTAPSVTGTTGTAIFVIDGVSYYPHVTAGVLTFTDTP